MTTASDRLTYPNSRCGADEAALDRLIERALAEESDNADATAAGDGGSSDPEAFLVQAAAFLRGRSDCAALIERLRALALPADDAPQATPTKCDPTPE